MKTRTYLITIVSFIFYFQIAWISATEAANKIMPLGDSIVQGISSGEPDEAFQVSYRKPLYDLLNADGYVITDEKCETNVAGIYVIGDLRQKYARQIVISAADGSTAALAAAHYVESKKAGQADACELPEGLLQ